MVSQVSSAVLALLVSSSCFSETISGTTDNAAANGYQWIPQDVLPAEAGLTVNGFFFRYDVDHDGSPLTATLNGLNGMTGDPLLMIDREWTGIVGQNEYEINALVQDLPAEIWGPMSFDVEGRQESISGVEFTFDYRYDPCTGNPLHSPTCPGYEQAFIEEYVPVVSEPEPVVVFASVESTLPQIIADPVVNSIIQQEPVIVTEAPVEEQENEEEKTSDEEAVEEEGREESTDGDNDRRTEIGLAAAEKATAESQQIAQEQNFFAMSFVAGFDAYSKSLPGGYMEDAEGYKSEPMPDSRRGLRNGLAQQILWDEMVQEQFER